MDGAVGGQPDPEDRGDQEEDGAGEGMRREGRERIFISKQLSHYTGLG